MTSPEAIAESERLRLEACVQEPIRTPGSIQSHGVLVVLDTDARTVLLASENCSRVFDAPVERVLSADLVDLLGAEAADAVLGVADGRRDSFNPVVVGGGLWDAIVHRVGRYVIVEFEPRDPDGPSPAISGVLEAIRRLSQVKTVEQLRRDTVEAISELTGFDRVMLYHFHPDGHGEVVAERRAEGMEPFLGLHFPASDIPQQARALYLTKLSRPIVDTERPVASLLTMPDSPIDAGLDLGVANLRSVSPYHLQFMRNMGQASTLSFSLVSDGALIGMITCAHRSEHRIPFPVRAILEILANQVALQLSSIAEIDRLGATSRIREFRTVLVRQFGESEELINGLLDGAVSLFDVLPADGVVVSIGGSRRSAGHAPAADEFETWMRNRRDLGMDALVTNSLGLDDPELAASWGNTAGLLVVPLGPTDYFALFRQEVISTVDWLGDQTSTNRRDDLSPRLSFSSWTQSVRGSAPAWGIVEAEAQQLGRDIEISLHRRAESHLAAAALNDALTGIPNRRFLDKRLDLDLLQRHDGSTALLFIDLDRFKAVNDSLGHDVGDDLLIEVADRLASLVRAEDTVARLGGDEFVIVCSDASLEQSKVLADRVLAGLRTPITVGTHTIELSASVGIALTTPGMTPTELLRMADVSMYRAKSQGGDRAYG